MKKIKIIDLFNKIANGEEVPKRIAWGVHEFKYFAGTYNEIDSFSHSTLETYIDFTISELNDEVEIIEDTPKEETKIPEELKLYAPYPECDDTRFDDVEEKINEIIKYLESKEK